jgi:[protein-PII] uridylyltransferase
VATRAQTQRGGTELFVYAGDQDLLFSHITHTLAKMGLNVMDARIITTTDHHTLDTFIVLEENGLPVSEEHRLQTLQENLHKQLATLPEICHIEQRIGRKNRHFSIPTQLNMSTDTHKQQTILEVSTADTPGVLSRLGDAFTACDIRLHNAKIATYGERAQDTFFITNQHTQQALDHTQSEQLKTTILQHLDYHEPRT